MLRKIILGIAAFALVLAGVAQVDAADEGVNIIDAAEQAGFEITCPEGVANCVDATDDTAATDYSITSIQIFILKLLGGLLNFAALAAVLMLVVASVRLVIAMGNQERLQAVKKHILWILAGLAVIILSLLIVKNVTEMIYKSTEPPPICGNDIKEESEQCDGSDLGGKDSKKFKCSVDCELVKKCLELVEDGLFGKNTIEARSETPNLAMGFKGGDDCVERYRAKKVSKMSIRKSGEKKCQAVEDFQIAYNKQTCNEETGTREDDAKVDEEEKCDPVDVEHGTVGEYPGCEITCDENYKLSKDGKTCGEEVCDPATVTNGEVGDFPDCKIVCDDGYGLSEGGETCEELTGCGSAAAVCARGETKNCNDIPVGSNHIVYFDIGDGDAMCNDDDCSGWIKIRCGFDTTIGLVETVGEALLSDKSLEYGGSSILDLLHNKKKNKTLFLPSSKLGKHQIV